MKLFSTVIVVVVLIFISAAFGGKQSKGTRSSRRSDPNTTNVTDAATDSQKTLAEWLQLPKESLVLRCSNLHLVSRGSVNILANRLFTYYHPPAALSTSSNNRTVPSSKNSTGPSTVSPVISSDTGTISDIVRQELRAIFSSGDFTDMLSLMPTTTSTALNSPAVDLNHDGRPELPSQNVQSPLVLSSPQPAMPTHHLLSNQQQPTSSRLPALPSTVLRKIQAGEFVNFNDLLPHSMSPSTSDDFTIQLSQSSATNPTSLSLVPVLSHHGLKFTIFHLGYKLGIIFCEQLYITILCS